MAGGSGTRFWPKSTSKKPKQLLAFGKGGKSLLAQTLDRFVGVVPDNQRIIVTTELLADAIKADAPRTKVLAEPQGRNSAPCVYWAARVVADQDPRGVMLVMSADHYVPKVDAFRECVRHAADWAKSHDDLVALGVTPSRPETGYGYLRLGERLNGGPSKVEAFVEKPSFERAKEFVKAGYLWNGGMFVWRADMILRAFDEFMPEYKTAWDSSNAQVTRAYPQMTATSIDFAIMEKAKNVVTFPLDCGWDDLGSWTSLEGVADAIGARHAAGVLSAGELIAVESQGLIVDAPGRLVAVLGLDDVIIVEQGNAILVAKKDRAQDIRLLVDAVKKLRPELA